jgi:hypothetical protein
MFQHFEGEVWSIDRRIALLSNRIGALEQEF